MDQVRADREAAVDGRQHVRIGREPAQFVEPALFAVEREVAEIEHAVAAGAVAAAPGFVEQRRGLRRQLRADDDVHLHALARADGGRAGGEIDLHRIDARLLQMDGVDAGDGAHRAAAAQAERERGADAGRCDPAPTRTRRSRRDPAHAGDPWRETFRLASAR
nr:hypothetical protein [Lysobacter enzymogenes]